MTKHLIQRLRRATGLGAVAMFALALRRTGRRLSPPRAVQSFDKQAAAAGRPFHHAACRHRQRLPAARPHDRHHLASTSTRVISPPRPGRASLLTAPGRARSSARSRASWRERARFACSRAARTRPAHRPRRHRRARQHRVRSSATTTSSSWCAARPSGAPGRSRSTRRTAVGRLAGTGRQRDAPERGVRPAQLDPLRRQEPRHHAEPGHRRS